MKQNNPPAIPARQSPQFKPIIETKLDVALFYQIFPEEILGSGQFGTVYGGRYIVHSTLVYMYMNVTVYWR